MDARLLGNPQEGGSQSVLTKVGCVGVDRMCSWDPKWVAGEAPEAFLVPTWTRKAARSD